MYLCYKDISIIIGKWSLILVFSNSNSFTLLTFMLLGTKQ